MSIEAMRGRRESRRVLVAEDDPEMRRMLARQLRRAGLVVTELRSGRELEERLAEASREDAPDLLITDIHMPGSSGLDVIEGLASRSFPVIVITAFGEAHLHERASRLGVDAIFDKPFDLDDLVAKVEGLLGG